jgi:hypothetical protein
MPCYRCGVRQTDPVRGESPWRRGVLRDHLVLVCPTCVERADWAAVLDACPRCAGTHLIRRLDQVECLDCGQIRDTAVVVGARAPDTALADEVGRALARVLGPSRIP